MCFDLCLFYFARVVVLSCLFVLMLLSIVYWLGWLFDLIVLFRGCWICYLFVLDLVCSFACSAAFGDLVVFSLVLSFAVYVVECC